MRELRTDEKHFLVNRQGKDFILYGGLIHVATEEGLAETDTNIIQFPSKENNWTTYVKAVVTFRDSEGQTRTFSGIGDASPDNVGRMIAAHCPRMAETRAIARALRVALDVQWTAFEELGDVEVEDTKPRSNGRSSEKSVDNSGDKSTADLKGPAAEYTLARIKKNLDFMGRGAEYDKLPDMTEMQAQSYLAMLQNERAAGAKAK